MNLKQLLDDDDAVSPVIGVILMVAITVILAAVIGTFVLGLGGQIQATAPTAQFDWDQSDHSDADGYQVTVSMQSGQSVDVARLSISADAANATASDDLASASNATAWSGLNDQNQTAAGASLPVVTSDPEDGLVEGDTVSLVWEAEGGSQSDTLTSHTVS